ncbi:MAG TPA: acyltransferase [Acidimicrobiia bacterium]|nr:acyltransferase [Acidimicrobiia bacterium]
MAANRSGTTTTADALGYQPALDGLRAIAIALVVPTHWVSNARPFLGGWIGVFIFFMLSGYLITSLLTNEYQRRRGIALRAFYQRRIARLAPALVVLLGSVVLVSALSQHAIFGQPPDVSRGAIATLTYSANWFAALGQTPHLGPFGALWSLSVEEQFYVLWPIALIVLLRRHNREVAGRVALGAAALLMLEQVLRWTVFRSSGDIFYYGSDGEGAIFLLTGCAAALLIPRGPAFTRSKAGETVRRYGGWALVPLVPVATLYAFRHTMRSYDFLISVGILMCTLVLLLSALTDSRPRRVLSTRPFVWLGRRSYSLYLWHLPVGAAVTWYELNYAPHMNLATHVFIAFVITMPLVELSYRYVELPMRKRLVARWTAAEPVDDDAVARTKNASAAMQTATSSTMPA